MATPFAIIVVELPPQVDYKYKNSAKINETILWETTGYIELTIKTGVYFIIWNLCATDLLHQYSLWQPYMYVCDTHQVCLVSSAAGTKLGTQNTQVFFE